MTAEEALEHCQAYLDRELDPATVARIDAFLAENPQVADAYAREREFHAFLKTRSARVNAPPNLADGIKARLARARTQKGAARPAAELSPSHPFWGSAWVLAVAGVVLAAAVIWAAAKSFQAPAPGTVSAPQVAKDAPSIGAPATTAAVPSDAAAQSNPPATSGHECPYLVACAFERELVASGATPVQLQTDDRAKMSAFFAEKLKLSIGALPSLTEFKLKPSGAGIATFQSLKKFDAPEAAFVVYNGPGKDSVTLLIHPWPDEEPMAANMTMVEGTKYWVATHGESAIATWKSDDGKLVLSLISTRTKDENFKMARDARREFNAQAAMLKRAAGWEFAAAE